MCNNTPNYGSVTIDAVIGKNGKKFVVSFCFDSKSVKVQTGMTICEIIRVFLCSEPTIVHCILSGHIEERECDIPYVLEQIHFRDQCPRCEMIKPVVSIDCRYTFTSTDGTKIIPLIYSCIDGADRVHYNWASDPIKIVCDQPDYKINKLRWDVFLHTDKTHEVVKGYPVFSIKKGVGASQTTFFATPTEDPRGGEGVQLLTDDDMRRASIDYFLVPWNIKG